MWRHYRVLMLAALFAACGRDESATTPASAGGWADLRAPATVLDWALPTLRPGTHSPGLARTHDGRLLLSWVNSQRGRRHVFQFSTYALAYQRWRGEPLTVLIGNALATTHNNSPRMVVSHDGTLWAQWLQQAGREGDVMLSRSRDGGANWSAPQMADGVGPRSLLWTALGIGTMWPETQGVGMAWMNGEENPSVHAITVAAGEPPGLAQVLETQADQCEPLAVAPAAHGPLLVYRRNSPGTGIAGEIRVVGRDASGWRAPVRVHANDRAHGLCSGRNGPAIAVHGQDVVVAWLTHEDSGASVIRMALSTDAGVHFAAPVEIYRGEDAGPPVAVQMDAQQVWVVWEKLAGEDDSLWLSRYSTDLQKGYECRDIARSHLAVGYARTLGAAQFVLSQGTGYLVWTEERADRTSILRGVKILPAQASPQ